MGVMWLSLLTTLACGLMHFNEGSPILKELSDKQTAPAEKEAPKEGDNPPTGPKANKQAAPDASTTPPTGDNNSNAPTDNQAGGDNGQQDNSNSAAAPPQQTQPGNNSAQAPGNTGTTGNQAGGNGQSAVVDPSSNTKKSGWKVGPFLDAAADVTMAGFAGAATSATTDNPLEGALAMGAGAAAQKTTDHFAKDYQKKYTALKYASKTVLPLGAGLTGAALTAFTQGHDDHDHDHKED